jgi:hypothetical protein
MELNPLRRLFLPPLQGEGWGGDGVRFRASSMPNPIPLPASPLKGEVRTAACGGRAAMAHPIPLPASPLKGEVKSAARGRAQE